MIELLLLEAVLVLISVAIGLIAPRFGDGALSRLEKDLDRIARRKKLAVCAIAAVAAIGSALILGSLPRLMRRPAWRDSLLLGMGVIVVANTRPFEGLALAAPAAVALAVWAIGKQSRCTARALAPALTVLCIGAAAMLYYNWRVTGSALALPYTVNRSQYAVAQVFIWQKPGPAPQYRHKVMRDFYLGGNWPHLT